MIRLGDQDDNMNKENTTDEQQPIENPPIAESIEENGFYLCNFDGDGYLPAFSYSVGLTKSYSHPELLIMGLSREINLSILEHACELVRDGKKFEIQTDYEEFLEGFSICFLPILKKHLPDYFGFGIEYYGDMEFEALQLIWPDKQSRWPWDEEFEPELLINQKLLDRDPNFKFYERLNLATFVTKGVFEGSPITYVVHDEDGDWQFLTDEDPTEENAMIVAFEEVVELDPTVNELFDLGYGQSAHRDSPQDAWQRDD